MIRVCFRISLVLISRCRAGGNSESMVSSVTAEIKSQVDQIEALAPTVPPLQQDIRQLKNSSSDLQATIAKHKAKIAANATDKASKVDTIANTENDIKILQESIAAKKAQIDPLPGKIEV